MKQEVQLQLQQEKRKNFDVLNYNIKLTNQKWNTKSWGSVTPDEVSKAARATASEVDGAVRKTEWKGRDQVNVSESYVEYRYLEHRQERLQLEPDAEQGLVRLMQLRRGMTWNWGRWN